MPPLAFRKLVKLGKTTNKPHRTMEEQAAVEKDDDSDAGESEGETDNGEAEESSANEEEDNDETQQEDEEEETDDEGDGDAGAGSDDNDEDGNDDDDDSEDVDGSSDSEEDHVDPTIHRNNNDSSESDSEESTDEDEDVTKQLRQLEKTIQPAQGKAVMSTQTADLLAKKVARIEKRDTQLNRPQTNRIAIRVPKNEKLAAALRRLEARDPNDPEKHRVYKHRQLKEMILGTTVIPKGKSTDAVVRNTKLLIGDYLKETYGFVFHFPWTSYTDESRYALITHVQLKFRKEYPTWTNEQAKVRRLLMTMAQDRKKAYITKLERAQLYSWKMRLHLRSKKNTISIISGGKLKQGQRMDWFVDEEEELQQRLLKESKEEEDPEPGEATNDNEEDDEAASDGLEDDLMEEDDEEGEKIDETEELDRMEGVTLSGGDAIWDTELDNISNDETSKGQAHGTNNPLETLLSRRRKAKATTKTGKDTVLHVVEKAHRKASKGAGKSKQPKPKVTDVSSSEATPVPAKQANGSEKKKKKKTVGVQGSERNETTSPKKKSSVVPRSTKDGAKSKARQTATSTALEEQNSKTLMFVPVEHRRPVSTKNGAANRAPQTNTKTVSVSPLSTGNNDKGQEALPGNPSVAKLSYQERKRLGMLVPLRRISGILAESDRTGKPIQTTNEEQIGSSSVIYLDTSARRGNHVLDTMSTTGVSLVPPVVPKRRTSPNLPGAGAKRPRTDKSSQINNEPHISSSPKLPPSTTRQRKFTEAGKAAARQARAETRRKDEAAARKAASRKLNEEAEKIANAHGGRLAKASKKK